MATDHSEKPRFPEALAAQGVTLGDRVSAAVKDLIHPIHRQGAVFAWEILGLFA